MIRNIKISLLIIAGWINVLSQNDNMGFEQGNFTGWNGKRGYVPSDSAGMINPHAPNVGFCCSSALAVPVNSPLTDTAARHTIMSAGGGVDNYGKFPVLAPVMPWAGFAKNLYSLRLGNDRVMDNGAGWELETMEYSLAVTASNINLAINYALVMNSSIGDPSHIGKHGPWFEMYILDQLGDTVPCSHELVLSEIIGSPIQWQMSSAMPVYGQVFYTSWITKILDLSAYIGQTLTVHFATADCWKGGHFGYAYVDLYSGLFPTNYVCYLGPSATLLQSPVTDSSHFYQWTGADTMATGHQFMPADTGWYELNFFDMKGCHTTLNYYVSDQQPVADFTYTSAGSTITFTNKSKYANTYFWSFGDGSISTDPAPAHKFTTTGETTITLIAGNACGADTVSQTLDILSLGKEASQADYKIVPHPNNGIFEIVAQAGEHIFAEVYDMEGRLIYSAPGKSNVCNINLSGQPQGLYLLRISVDDNSSYCTRILKTD